MAEPKSKSEAKRIETMSGTTAYNGPLAPKAKYRYFCDACTGVAFVVDEPAPKKDIVCTACGTHLGPAKPENYIKM